MSKRAEEAALKAYPEKMGMFHEADIHYEADLNKAARIKYIEGYKQAEKETFNRVSDWLRDNLYMYLYVSNGEPGLPLHAVIETMRESIMEIDNE